MWYEETNNLHLPVREMTVTLDDIVCLLHIPIHGKLMHYNDFSYKLGIQLMQFELGLSEKEAKDETSTQWGGNISIPNLKKLYDRLLHRCNKLVDSTNDNEEEELQTTRTHYIKAFVCLHLLEQVLRQYEYVQTNPRSPIMFLALKPDDVVVVFQDYRLHVLSHADRGRETTDEWRSRKGYIGWFLE